MVAACRDCRPRTRGRPVVRVAASGRNVVLTSRSTRTRNYRTGGSWKCRPRSVAEIIPTGASKKIRQASFSTLDIIDPFRLS